jgi:hypothetical protein
MSICKTWFPQQHDSYYHYFLRQLIVINNFLKKFIMAFKVLFDLVINIS